MFAKYKYRVKLLLNYIQSSPKSYILSIISFYRLMNLYKTKYKNKYVITLQIQAIGPFILSSIIYMKKCFASNIDPKNDLVVIIEDTYCSNTAFYEIVSRHFNLVKDPKMYHLILSANRKMLKKSKILLLSNTIKNGIIYNPNMHNLFKLTKQELEKGNNLLKKIGLSESDKFVTINNRDEFYWKKIRNFNFTHDSYRISSFSNLIPTVKHLQSLNFKVIRCGHFDGNEISSEGNIYTYQHLSEDERAFLDIYLHYKAEFSIMGSSGIAFFPLLFNKPILYHNFIPLGEGPNAENCVIVPTVLKDKNGKILSLSNIIKKSEYILDNYKIIKISGEKFQNTLFYTWNDIVPTENTSEDILEGLKELLIRYKTNSFIDNLDESQIKFKNLFPLFHPIRNMTGVCSSAFLKKYGKEFLS